jgi:hypothetical protein
LRCVAQNPRRLLMRCSLVSEVEVKLVRNVVVEQQ